MAGSMSSKTIFSWKIAAPTEIGRAPPAGKGNALLAVIDPQGIANSATDPARLGTWVENACLAHAWNSGRAFRIGEKSRLKSTEHRTG
jgi:hypothetical protein